MKLKLRFSRFVLSEDGSKVLDFTVSCAEGDVIRITRTRPGSSDLVFRGPGQKLASELGMIHSGSKMGRDQIPFVGEIENNKVIKLKFRLTPGSTFRSTGMDGGSIMLIGDGQSWDSGTTKKGIQLDNKRTARKTAASHPVK